MSESVSTSTDVATTSGHTDSALSSSDKIALLQRGQLNIFTTYTGESAEDKMAVFAAITDALPVVDHLGETINLTNVVVQVVEVANEDGELVSVLRVVLIDADGTAYAALSDGLHRSLVNLFGILGEPSTWDKPVPIKVVELKSRKGFRFFSIKLA